MIKNNIMKISREAKIGTITIITLGIFFWGFNFLKGKNIFSRTNTFYAVYENLGGLKESGAILLNGFKVGQVNNLELVNINGEHKILVTFLVDKTIKVPKGSSAVLFSESIMDIKAIKLSLIENSELHTTGDTLNSVVEQSILESIGPLAEDIKNITSALDSTTTKLNAILDSEAKNSLQNTIANIEKTSKSISNMLADGNKIDNTITEFNELISNLNYVSTQLKPVIDNLAMVTDSIDAVEIGSIINNTDNALASVNDILHKINNEEGSAGKLVNNDSLYFHLNNATKDLDLLLKDLKENPKRYVHFSLFGKK